MWEEDNEGWVGEGQHLEHFWSAFGNRTSRARGLRSTPSGPDDWQRVAGKRAQSWGVRVRRERKGRKVNTVLRGLDPRTGFPLNCRTPPLLGASGHYTVHHAQTQTLA